MPSLPGFAHRLRFRPRKPAPTRPVLSWALALACMLAAVGARADIDPTTVIRLRPSVVRVEAATTDGKLQMGSGVVIDKERVVTNCHVTRNAVNVAIVYGAARTAVEGQSSDLPHDLCLLSAPGLVAKPVPIAASKTLKQGQDVLALGYTGGFGLQASGGTIISLHRWSGSNVIQSTNSFTSGASGGGLFTVDGQLVGILTFRLRGGRAHYFAAPADWLIAQKDLKFTEITPQSGLSFWEESGDTQPRFLKAAALEFTRQWEALAQLAEQWVHDAADDPEAPYLLAVARESMNQLEPAVRALLQSVEIDPDYSRSWMMLVRIYERTGRRLEAQHAMAMLNVRNPKLGQVLSDELQSGGRDSR